VELAQIGNTTNDKNGANVNGHSIGATGGADEED
jgi:hypothetical protein